MNKNWTDQTNNIRIQQSRSVHGEHSAAIHMTSSFCFDRAEDIADAFSGERDGPIYSRYSNPNTNELVAKVCTMEGADDGFATTSGMASVFLSLMSQLEAGDHILSTNALFSSTHQLFTEIFPRFGITTTLLDPLRLEQWQEAVSPKTKILFVETPSNPGLIVTDLTFAGNFAKNHNLTFIVDNCFATPILQKPMQYGADLVVHSATKYMDGQGRGLGGIVVGHSEIMERVIFFARHSGPIMSPFNAWMISKGLETLELRMKAHSASANYIAAELENHPMVSKVYYPHLTSFAQYELSKSQMKYGGGIITFEVNGSRNRVFNFMNNTMIPSKVSNLGDSRTILTHPASTTHSKLSPDHREKIGISESMIRLSVGLENEEDILNDLIFALDKLE